MKKFISLTLCLLMLVLTFASCSSDEPVETLETTTRKAVTLGMYVITEDGTAPEAAQAVETAIKSIIRSKYTTNLEIEFLTAAEYYSAVEAKLEGMKKDAAAAAETAKPAESGDETEAVTTAATIVNEYGVTELRYPDLGENQIDIIMIADYAKYAELAEAGHLYNLDDTIKNASKKLNDYIYPTVLEAAKISGVYYGVPNNKPVANEATYMVIDRELASEYELQVSKVDSVSDLKGFLTWVKANKEGVTPFAGFYNDLDVRYMNYDAAGRALSGEFSLVGDYNKNSASIADAENLFANADYKKDITALAEMYYAGLFGSADAEKYAVTVKTGDIEAMAADSENFDIVVLDSVAAEPETLSNCVFSVSKYCADFTRAMEVITLLNTSDEIRNLLQYGIENVNYEVDPETKELTRLNNEYMMDIYKTGNVYMAYAEEDMPVNIWEISKQINLASGPDAANAFGGFTVPADTPAETDPESGETTKEALTVDASAAVALAEASEAVYAALTGAADITAFKAVVDSVATEYSSVIATFLATDNASSVYALYKAQ